MAIKQTYQAHIAYLALGANLGDPQLRFTEARAQLQQYPEVEVISSAPLYLTPAIGGPADQPDYLNSVIEISTTLSALKLLSLCQALEHDAGRTREIHWGPRTLDIDLIYFADQTNSSEQLTLPHPRLHERHFVLLPLADIAPKLIHPLLDLTTTEMLQQLPKPEGIRLLQQQW